MRRRHTKKRHVRRHRRSAVRVGTVRKGWKKTSSGWVKVGHKRKARKARRTRRASITRRRHTKKRHHVRRRRHASYMYI